MRQRSRREREAGARRRSAWAGVEALESRTLLAFSPTANEQYMLELLNHMRADPLANLALMTRSLGNPARSNHPDIDSALRQFMVSGTALSQQWGGLTSAPPLAWNEDLYEAAEAHTNVMIATNSQTHQAPGEPDLGQRLTNAGYTGFSTAAENVYAFATGVFYGHAGFAIDWGDTPTGIQTPAGHRDNMMSSAFREVGIRILSETNPATQVGPLVITQNFGSRFNFGNPFLLGVVYSDNNNDAFYAPGEGLANVAISATGAAGTFTTVSMDAGGYQLKVPAGVYDVTISGAGFGSAVTYRNIIVGGANVKVDAVRGVAPPAPNIRVEFEDIVIAAGDLAPSSTDGTDFGTVNLAQSITRVFTIRNTGGAPLQLGTSPRVRLNGSGESFFALTDDADGLIMPQETTTFTIRFEPGSVNNANVNVTIVSDDPDTGEYKFRIRGFGQDAPDMAVRGGGTPGLLIADGDTTPRFPDGTGFSSLNVALQTRTRVFTIENNGSRPLELSEVNGRLVTVTGVHAGNFVVVQQPAAVIAPGGKTTFKIRFNPSTAGVRSATVRIAANDPDTGVFDFAVRGTGVLAPIVQVLGMGVVIAGAGLPSMVNGTDFGSIGTDAGRVIRTFVLRNVGSAALNLSAIANARVRITGVAAGSFSAGIKPGTVVAVGGTTSFKIRFDPVTTGLKNARVFIDTLNGGSVGFNVSGVGV